MKILLAEDESKTVEFLAKGLRESGFIVDSAQDGAVGLDLALKGAYDLLILDVMLPSRDGLSIIKELRRSGIEAPAIFLSARDSVDDRIAGLESGADCYLVKPFSFSEVLAHVRTQLRRRAGKTEESFRLADLEVDPVRHRVFRGGRRLDLTPKEFSLLSLLMRRQGEILGRSLIADQVWGINFDSETNVVDAHIARLRSKLDGPFEVKLLQTVRGLGYVLRANDQA